MNKSELIAKIAVGSDVTQKQAESALNIFIQAVTSTLVKGDKLALLGFGTFETAERKPRLGRNPATGQEITIPATTVPKFKAGKLLKQALIK